VPSGANGTLPAQRTIPQKVTGTPTGPILYVWNGTEYSQGGGVAVYADAGSTLLRTIGPPNSGDIFDDMTADPSGHLFLAFHLLNDGPHGPGDLNIYWRRGTRVVQRLKQTHPFGLPILDSSENLNTMCAPGRVCTYAASGDQRVVKQDVIRRIALGKISPYYKGAHDFSVDISADLAINRGGVVQIFAPGQTEPYWQISPQTLDGMTSTAFDSKGDLYLAMRCVEPGYDGGVAEYAPNTNKYPIRILSTLDGVVCPEKLAIDASDNLYVLGGYTQSNVTVFPPTSNTPIRTMTEGLVNAQSHTMILDALGDVYVSNGGYGSDPGNVVVYPPGESVPIRTVTQGVHNPLKLAAGP